MNEKEILIVGGGGHCISLTEMINSTDEYTIKGILDIKEKVGQDLCGIEIIGSDDDISQFAEQGYSFLIGVGQVKTSEIRRKISDRIKASGGKMARIIASSAYVSDTAVIGEGSVVGHLAFVNAEVKIGENCIINSGAVELVIIFGILVMW